MTNANTISAFMLGSRNVGSNRDSLTIQNWVLCSYGNGLAKIVTEIKPDTHEYIMYINDDIRCSVTTTRHKNAAIHSAKRLGYTVKAVSQAEFDKVEI